MRVPWIIVIVLAVAAVIWWKFFHKGEEKPGAIEKTVTSAHKAIGAQEKKHPSLVVAKKGWKDYIHGLPDLAKSVYGFSWLEAKT